MAVCCRPLRKGRTVPEFEQAAFSTPVGQTTGVIRTSYGFHIIHVEAKQQARLKPLDEVKAEIEPTLKQQKAAAQAQSVANTMQALARTKGMDKAANDRNSDHRFHWTWLRRPTSCRSWAALPTS